MLETKVKKEDDSNSGSSGPLRRRTSIVKVVGAAKNQMISNLTAAAPTKQEGAETKGEREAGPKGTTSTTEAPTTEGSRLSVPEPATSGGDDEGYCKKTIGNQSESTEEQSTPIGKVFHVVYRHRARSMKQRASQAKSQASTASNRMEGDVKEAKVTEEATPKGEENEGGKSLESKEEMLRKSTTAAIEDAQRQAPEQSSRPTPEAGQERASRPSLNAKTEAGRQLFRQHLDRISRNALLTSAAVADSEVLAAPSKDHDDAISALSQSQALAEMTSTEINDDVTDVVPMKSTLETTMTPSKEKTASSKGLKGSPQSVLDLAAPVLPTTKPQPQPRAPPATARPSIPPKKTVLRKKPKKKESRHAAIVKSAFSMNDDDSDATEKAGNTLLKVLNRASCHSVLDPCGASPVDVSLDDDDDDDIVSLNPHHTMVGYNDTEEAREYYRMMNATEIQRRDLARRRKRTKASRGSRALRPSPLEGNMGEAEVEKIVVEVESGEVKGDGLVKQKLEALSNRRLRKKPQRAPQPSVVVVVADEDGKREKQGGDDGVKSTMSTLTRSTRHFAGFVGLTKREKITENGGGDIDERENEGKSDDDERKGDRGSDGSFDGNSSAIVEGKKDANVDRKNDMGVDGKRDESLEGRRDESLEGRRDEILEGKGDESEVSSDESVPSLVVEKAMNAEGTNDDTVGAKMEAEHEAQSDDNDDGDRTIKGFVIKTSGGILEIGENDDTTAEFSTVEVVAKAEPTEIATVANSTSPAMPRTSSSVSKRSVATTPAFFPRESSKSSKTPTVPYRLRKRVYSAVGPWKPRVEKETLAVKSTGDEDAESDIALKEVTLVETSSGIHLIFNEDENADDDVGDDTATLTKKVNLVETSSGIHMVFTEEVNDLLLDEGVAEIYIDGFSNCEEIEVTKEDAGFGDSVASKAGSYASIGNRSESDDGEVSLPLSSQSKSSTEKKERIEKEEASGWSRATPMEPMNTDIAKKKDRASREVKSVDTPAPCGGGVSASEKKGHVMSMPFSDGERQELFVVGATPLILAIKSKLWDNAIRIMGEDPPQVRTWSAAKYQGGFLKSRKSPPTYKLRSLPLHVAMESGAPYRVVSALVDAYGEAAACHDFRNRLPIQLAARRGADESILQLLVKAHARILEGTAATASPLAPISEQDEMKTTKKEIGADDVDEDSDDSQDNKDDSDDDESSLSDTGDEDDDGSRGNEKDLNEPEEGDFDQTFLSVLSCDDDEVLNDEKEGKSSDNGEPGINGKEKVVNCSEDQDGDGVLVASVVSAADKAAANNPLTMSPTEISITNRNENNDSSMWKPSGSISNSQLDRVVRRNVETKTPSTSTEKESVSEGGELLHRNDNSDKMSTSARTVHSYPGPTNQFLIPATKEASKETKAAKSLHRIPSSKSSEIPFQGVVHDTKSSKTVDHSLTGDGASAEASLGKPTKPRAPEYCEDATVEVLSKSGGMTCIEFCQPCGPKNPTVELPLDVAEVGIEVDASGEKTSPSDESFREDPMEAMSVSTERVSNVITESDNTSTSRRSIVEKLRRRLNLNRKEDGQDSTQGSGTDLSPTTNDNLVSSREPELNQRATTPCQLLSPSEQHASKTEQSNPPKQAGNTANPPLLNPPPLPSDETGEEKRTGKDDKAIHVEDRMRSNPVIRQFFAVRPERVTPRAPPAGKRVDLTAKERDEIVVTATVSNEKKGLEKDDKERIKKHIEAGNKENILKREDKEQHAADETKSLWSPLARFGGKSVQPADDNSKHQATDPDATGFAGLKWDTRSKLEDYASNCFGLSDLTFEQVLRLFGQTSETDDALMARERDGDLLSEISTVASDDRSLDSMEVAIRKVRKYASKSGVSVPELLARSRRAEV